MRGKKPFCWIVLAGFLIAVWIVPSVHAQTPLRLANTEPPATVGGADAYPGQVAVRSVVDGYVVAVEGEWGSATLFVQAEGAVEPVAAMDPRGTVLVREGEVVVAMPAAGELLRMTVAPVGSEEPAAAKKLLHARHGTTDLLEVQGLHILTYSPAVASLSASGLLAVEDFEAVTASVFHPPAAGLEVLAAGAFNQTPPDDGGGGCSSSCSVSCPPTNNSCTATGGGAASCCTCRCNQGSASCSCR